MRGLNLGCSLAAVLLTACGSQVVTTPAPTPEPGARIRFLTRPATGGYVTGRLVSFRADTMVFERFVPGDAGAKWVPTSLPADSIALLQVRVGRRGNAGRGALIGGAVGLGLGLACAGGDSGGWYQPTAEECLFSGLVTGAGTGLLIGVLVRTDVWAPTAVPRRSDTAPGLVAAASPARIGVRIPIRLLP
jgi:hypothetical protein